MTATQTSPGQVEIGPLPEEELPPIVQAGAVWRNGRLVSGTLPVPARTTVPEQSVAAQQEQQAALRRQVNEAAMRADPTFVYALWRWVQMQTAAPGYGDVAAWMEEAAQTSLPVGVVAMRSGFVGPVPSLSRKQLASLEKARASRAAKRVAKAAVAGLGDA